MKLCPCCGAATRVYGRNEENGLVVRYRRCLNPDCQAKFKTTSTPEEVLKEDALFQRAEQST